MEEIKYFDKVSRTCLSLLVFFIFLLFLFLRDCKFCHFKSLLCKVRFERVPCQLYPSLFPTLRNFQDICLQILDGL